ncbi:extracellular solute-binding protein [Catenovulum sp. 2E275]|uniref:extracellular solute-binding protein n=1 Tax=Catenovulum sp. 2E275 TaxID=2980497 RepID=UPI0021D3B79D|nr:extracellular solute-binding protein [Catenovulum sp. 2E275]MCU4677019.1 extracellular solute-binding protein [Catenovulum sp. 2E275]
MWRTLTAPDEMQVFEQQVKRFNQLNPQTEIIVEAIPHGSYSDSVIGGALAKDLPCILAVDQPNVANYAWSGLIQPLYDLSENNLTNQLIKAATVKRINPSGIGIYQNKVYSLGAFDIALAMFTRKSLIHQLKVRLPSVEQPWSVEEFEHILQKIKQLNQYKYTLNLNLSGVGEWSSYAFLPMLKSSGADLIERKNYRKSEGILNSQAAINWGTWLQNTINSGFTQVQTGEHALFERGLVAIDYNGSWMIDRYKKALGDDLLILPTIDFGHGAYIGGGSWHYSITRQCKQPKVAARFIEFIMSDQQISYFSEHTGFIPTSQTAAQHTRLYRPQGELYRLYQMSAEHVVMRPATPGYPAISNIFAQAIRRISEGEQVQTAFDRAVDEIEQNILDNRGYR